MDMFTSYGHIKKPKENDRFFYDFSLGQSLLNYSYDSPRKKTVLNDKPTWILACKMLTAN